MKHDALGQREVPGRLGSERVFQGACVWVHEAGLVVCVQGSPISVADVVETDGIVSCRSVPTAWPVASLTLGER